MENITDKYNAMHKIIWMYWAQGWENAPDIIKRCAESWQSHNKGWEFKILDKNNVNDCIEIDIPHKIWKNMTAQHRAAHIRLKLLKKYGGVWVDSTCFALKPLENWLPHYMHSGFFAFRWLPNDTLKFVNSPNKKTVGKDRMMASWFIACEKENHLVVELSKKFDDYIIRLPQKTVPKNKISRKLLCLYKDYVEKKQTRAKFWLNPLVVKLLKTRPYLVINAVFTYLIHADPKCKKIWDNTPTFSAASLFQFQEYQLDPVIVSNLLNKNWHNRLPLQKLDKNLYLQHMTDCLLKSSC